MVRLECCPRTADKKPITLEPPWQLEDSPVTTKPRKALTKRNLLIDALRGLCFVLMTADHLPENLLRRFSNTMYGPFGFFTAAAGFVFLSGLVAGVVYERYWQIYSPRAMMRRVWRRLRAIYLTHLALYAALLIMVVVHVPGSSTWHLDLFSKNPQKAVWLGVSLLHEPKLLSILPMYCFFLALTPILLRELRLGNVRWVLSGSVVLWMVAGLFIRVPVDPDGICFGVFNPLSYQLLFVFGLAFGAGRIPVDSLGLVPARPIVVLSFGIAVFFFLLRWAYATSSTVVAFVEPFHQWFSVMQLGPLRVLNFAAFGVALYWLSRQREWGDCSNLLWRSLAFLGQHSLPVFAWSILLTYMAISVLPEHPHLSVRALALGLAVTSLLFPAFLHAKLLQHLKKN
jgi:hypothetical protein